MPLQVLCDIITDILKAVKSPLYSYPRTVECWSVWNDCSGNHDGCMFCFVWLWCLHFLRCSPKLVLTTISKCYRSQKKNKAHLHTRTHYLTFLMCTPHSFQISLGVLLFYIFLTSVQGLNLHDLPASTYFYIYIYPYRT